MPNIARLNGHRFSSYLATAVEQVCKANMADTEIWWSQAAPDSKFNSWFIMVKGHGGNCERRGEIGALEGRGEGILAADIMMRESTCLPKWIPDALFFHLYLCNNYGFFCVGCTGSALTTQYHSVLRICKDVLKWGSFDLTKVVFIRTERTKGPD